MNPSPSPPTYLTHQDSLSQQTGSLPHRVAAYEIVLLASAQRRARDKETAFFEQLSNQHGWQLSPPQQGRYGSRLQRGYTLILTDPAKTILWTTANFLGLTGYRPREVVGQTPQLLQGAGTDPQRVRQVGEALRQARPVEADLLNYRKDGQSYWCRLWIDPLVNGQGEATHFIATTVEYAGQERLR